MSLTGGFNPVAGNTFDILDGASFSGTFSVLELPALDAGLNWDTSQLYTSGIFINFPRRPGDYNDDGTVNAADYVVWRKNEGTMNVLPNDAIGAARLMPNNTSRAPFRRSARAIGCRRPRTGELDFDC